MWKIDDLEFPFSKAKDSVTTYWQTFVKNFEIPYIFLSDRIRVILDSARLTIEEIFDVEASWEEIKKDQAKKFTNVDKFLEELKS